MRAAPSGSRELRTATSPVGSTAHSTQLPLGLLRRLFCQVTPSNWPAEMPLTACVISNSLVLLLSGIVRRQCSPVCNRLLTRRANARAFGLAYSRDCEHDNARTKLRGVT